MLHSLRFVLLACLLLPIAQPAGEKKSALDKPTLEAYVRHLFVWGPQIKVEISNAKPSALPGMMEVSVRASAGNASQDVLFYVSKDGQKIVQGSVYDVKDNPFKADLDKLKTDLQPSFGRLAPPVWWARSAISNARTAKRKPISLGGISSAPIPSRSGSILKL